jgi:hypothetical protein
MDLTVSSIGSVFKNNEGRFKLRKDYQSAFILKGFDYKRWIAMPSQLLADRRISSGARDLWCLLQALGNEKGYSYYGQRKLARFLKIDVRTLQRYQTELVKYGWLIVEVGTAYRSNNYYIVWPPGLENPKWKSYLKKEKTRGRR